MADTHLRADSACDNHLARREALAALFVAPVAIAPVAALAAPPELVAEWEDPVLRSREVDANFWALRDWWKKIYSDWKADLANYPDRDMPDDVMDGWGARHDAAEYAMLIARITTLPALYAKMDAIKEDPDNFLRSKEDGTTVFEAVMWDVERLIMKEYRA